MTAVFSRRSVLGAGVVATGVGLAVGSGPAAARSESAGDAAAAVSHDPLAPVRSLFSGHEGREYIAASPRAMHRLTLAEVGDLHGGGDAENRFRVVFTTGEDARDGIYRIQQDGALLASLFLARVSGHPELEGIVDRSERAS
ncbi:hypothetical protein ACWGJP_05920 [Microbacterium sp. NPDC055903]